MKTGVKMPSLLDQKYQTFLQDPQIEMISFDIFDTLFFRSCTTPHKLFEKIGEIPEVKELFDTPSSFVEYRQNAEKKAREQTLNEEISLTDIYAQLPLQKSEQDKLKELELFVEKEMLVLNLQLSKWIEQALEHNKKVVLCSDIYFTLEELEKIALYKLPHKEQLSAIYLSSEHNARKATGKLFTKLLEDCKIEAKALVHIGDNLRSDIAIASSFGINTLYYGVQEFEHKAFENETLYLQDLFIDKQYLRLLSMLQNPYDKPFEAFYYSLGASIFAPIFWEFSHWLAKLKERFQLQDLLFLMREGALFRELFLQLYPEIPSSLLYVSRASTQFLELDPKNLSASNLHSFREYTLEDLYTSYGLEITNSLLKQYAKELCSKLSEIKIDNSTLAQNVIADLQNRQNEIEQKLEEQKINLYQYLKGFSHTKSNVFIDFGGGGTVIQRLFKNYKQTDTQSYAILLYQTKRGYRQLQEYQTFSFFPYTQRVAKALESLGRSPEFIEILLNGAAPSSIAYSQDGTAIVQTPLTNTQTISRISKAFKEGIDSFFSFAKLYDLQAQSYSRQNLALMLTRLVELPTKEEAEYLGALEYDEGKSSKHCYTIVSNKEKEKLTQEKLDNFYHTFLNNPYGSKLTTPWPQGLLTSIQENFLTQFYGVKKSPNEQVIQKLLKKLTSIKQKELMVYGAGQLFEELILPLQIRGLTIKTVIDSRAEIQSFWVGGFEVLCLEKALEHLSEATIVIASGVFYNTIAEKLHTYADQKQLKLTLVDCSD